MLLMFTLTLFWSKNMFCVILIIQDFWDLFYDRIMVFLKNIPYTFFKMAKISILYFVLESFISGN